MFTLNHQEPPAHEGLWQVEWVSFNASKREVSFGPPATNGCQVISTGIVYVMNETGATVAKYDLTK